MSLSIPTNLRAEALYNYLSDVKKTISITGAHKRNALKDIASIAHENDEIKIEISRHGLYDILPEALFHPIDRFDNLPANDYKERFAEEVEQQQREEEEAREFLSLYDTFLFDLSASVTAIRERDYADTRVLTDIICDSFPEEYAHNRFIMRTKEFTTRCRTIRGDVTKITLMLRKIMADEGLELVSGYKSETITDASPRYSYRVYSEGDTEEDGVYLGNSFDENVLIYEVGYWSDERCDETFPEFINEIKMYEEFLNDYFMGVETKLRISISTMTLPVRLSDEVCFNYLGYNTNL